MPDVQASDLGEAMKKELEEILVRLITVVRDKAPPERLAYSVIPNGEEEVCSRCGGMAWKGKCLVRAHTTILTSVAGTEQGR